MRTVLDRHKVFAVGTCLCRKLDKLKGPFNPCKHPLETCIMCDDYATYYVETGLGRYITKEEALEILREGEKDGRIINVTNSQDGENICSCCDCGCGMLWMKKKFPGPSKDLWANFFSVIDYDKCVSCGSCAKRCPFGCIKRDKEGKYRVNLEECMGCGLCVSACKKRAIVLHKKENAYVPPVTYDDAVEIWTKETKKDWKRYK